MYSYVLSEWFNSCKINHLVFWKNMIRCLTAKSLAHLASDLRINLIIFFLCSYVQNPTWFIAHKTTKIHDLLLINICIPISTNQHHKYIFSYINVALCYNGQDDNFCCTSKKICITILDVTFTLKLAPTFSYKPPFQDGLACDKCF